MDKNKGERCEEMEDGGSICKRYKKQGNQKLATGTDIEFSLDRKSCTVRIIGDINDDDVDWANQKAKRIEGDCKKGF